MEIPILKSWNCYRSERHEFRNRGYEYIQKTRSRPQKHERAIVFFLFSFNHDLDTIVYIDSLL